MPGIDTDLEALPARLGALLVVATAKLEAQASGAAPEAVARGVGVIARSGAALMAFAERLARRRAGRARGEDATEEADMDDADDAGREGSDLDDDDEERLERRLRTLACNLRVSDGVEGEFPGAGARDTAIAPGELGRPGAGAPEGA